MKHFLATIAFLCHSPLWAHDVVQHYNVVQIVDGYTLRIEGEDRSLKCRLSGIIAPELDEMFGQVSRESLAELAHGRNVHVHVINTEDKGLLGCRVWVNDRDLSLEQVARGMAWMYRRHTIDARLLKSENTAKSLRTGLWSDPDLATPKR